MLTRHSYRALLRVRPYPSSIHLFLCFWGFMRLSCTTFVEAGRAAAFLASRRASFPLSSFLFFTYFPEPLPADYTSTKTCVSKSLKITYIKDWSGTILGLRPGITFILIFSEHPLAQRHSLVLIMTTSFTVLLQRHCRISP
jgi:hypothetical protein